MRYKDGGYNRLLAGEIYNQYDRPDVFEDPLTADGFQMQGISEI